MTFVWCLLVTEQSELEVYGEVCRTLVFNYSVIFALQAELSERTEPAVT